MKFRNTIAIIYFLALGQFMNAQHQPVFTDYSGTTLLNLLVDEYKPNVVLEYSAARDTLYSKIDAQNDTLECVYTGFKIYLDPTQDPTVAAYMNGGPNGLNAEHTFPQSLGASTGNARSDMHHIYPARIDVNSERGSKPFRNISNNATSLWFYENQQMSNTPSNPNGQYSRSNASGFEPRDVHKGNVARSMFYFYTMYKSQADAANPNFFESQRTTLCEWHIADPVDQAEWDRTFAIAHYQDDKPNPFVLDCTLAERTYCSDIENYGCVVSTDSPILEKPFKLKQNIPNPAQGSTIIPYQLDKAAHVQIWLINPLGQKQLLVSKELGAGSYELQLENQEAGLYFCQMLVVESGQRYQGQIKIVIE